MKQSNHASSGGVGFAGVLAVLFIGLKLTGYINWSWLWVLSPLWIPAAIILTLLAIATVAATLGGLLLSAKSKK